MKSYQQKYLVPEKPKKSSKITVSQGIYGIKPPRNKLERLLQSLKNGLAYYLLSSQSSECSTGTNVIKLLEPLSYECS